ncbi:MAG: DNA-processing protein DprA [Spirochaetales bacterium]|jgi:DNA processing protein|nr:DNA-processing protein DprA [Spirochaetales bacterium]
MTGELLFILAAAQIPRLKPRERIALLKAAAGDSPESLTRPRVEALLGRRCAGDYAPRLWASRGEEIIKLCGNHRIGILPYTSPDYPPQLREIYDPPLVLYIRGVPPDYTRPMAAMVGTRFPSSRGRSAAFAMAFDFGRRDIAVVSGLARGIDLACHLGNLAGGGRTVAVLAGGLDTVYPRAHLPAARRILQGGGCLLSEYPPGTSPRKYHFPQRNRIISGLARGTVVVQAPLKSGALITADFALEQGRDLYVHRDCLGLMEGESEPGFQEAGDPSAGILRLYAEGVPAAAGGEDILSDWGFEGGPLAGPAGEGEGPPWEAPEWENLTPSGRLGRRLAAAMEEELGGRQIRYQERSFRGRL